MLGSNRNPEADPAGGYSPAGKAGASGEKIPAGGGTALDRRSLACHCSKVTNYSQKCCDWNANVLSRAGINDPLKISIYRHGAVIEFPSKGEPEPPEEVERAGLMQSEKSRRNCAFSLGNAETDWLAMATLTYRENPPEYETVKDHRKRFLDSMRCDFGTFDYAWFLEFTRKAVAHFHVFIGSGGDLGEALRGAPRETVARSGKETDLIRGEVESAILRHWRRLTSDDSEEWERFQRGGIVEAMRTPDAAGRYAAKEAGKRVQKIAPWPVSQWWGMSRAIKPELRRKKAITVREYLRAFPDGRMRSKVWEASIFD